MIPRQLLRGCRIVATNREVCRSGTYAISIRARVTFDRRTVLHEGLAMSGPGACSNANRSHLRMQLRSSTPLFQALWVPILVIGMRDGTDTRRLRCLPSPMYPGVRMLTAANASGTVRPRYASGVGVGWLLSVLFLQRCTVPAGKHRWVTQLGCWRSGAACDSSPGQSATRHPDSALEIIVIAVRDCSVSFGILARARVRSTGHRHAGVGLLEDRGDLGFGELRLLHGTSWLGNHARKFYFRAVHESGRLTSTAVHHRGHTA